MNKKDLNYIAALEKAVEQEYGHQATINPKSLWNEDKEKEYLNQLKEFEVLDRKTMTLQEKVDVNGVLIPKKLFNSDTNKTCNICDTYSFNREDDIYLTKFKSCFKCYVNHIEGREHKYLSGDKNNGK